MPPLFLTFPPSFTSSCFYPQHLQPTCSFFFLPFLFFLPSAIPQSILASSFLCQPTLTYFEFHPGHTLLLSGFPEFLQGRASPSGSVLCHSGAHGKSAQHVWLRYLGFCSYAPLYVYRKEAVSYITDLSNWANPRLQRHIHMPHVPPWGYVGQVHGRC